MNNYRPHIFRLVITCLMCLVSGITGEVRSQTTRDTARANTIIRIANKVQNPDAAIALYDSAFSISQEAGYTDGAFLALITMGIKYFESQDYINYRETTYEALDWAEKCSQPDAVSWCYINIGESWFYQGEYATANEFYYKSLEELNKRTREITQTTANIYNSLGMVNMRLNQYGKALNYYNMAENVSKLAHVDYQLAIAYENKGLYYLMMEQTDSAEKYFNQELSIGKKIGKLDLEAFAHAQLGKTYISQGKYEKAINSLQVAITLAQNRFNPPVIDAAFSLGDVLRLMGRYREAESILLWAYHETIAHRSRDYYINCYTKLSALYRSAGMDNLAIKYMDTLSLLKDSMTNADKAHAINNLEIKYRTAEKDKQLAESTLLIEKQEGKLTLKNILIVSALVGVCLLVVLLTALYRSFKNRQKLQDEMIKSLRQTNTIDVLNAMVEGEEKERIRIARELHDGIGGMVSAAMMRFSTLPRKDPQLAEDATYSGAMSLMNEIGDEIRKTAHNLMPEILLKQTLSDAIHSLCNTVQVKGSLEIDSQAYGDFSMLSQEVKLNIYRIIQELLKNVVKHSQATKVLVQVVKHGYSFTITVEDNGTGFDSKALYAGMGLLNIHARVRSLGGHFTFEANEDKGTTAYIEFDMQNGS